MHREEASHITRFLHPICRREDVKAGAPYRFLLHNRAYVLWRAADGTYGCMADACPHRRALLSAGSVENGRIRCAYHGWNMEADGTCHSPAEPDLKLKAESYRIVERRGHLWMTRREKDEDPGEPFPAEETDGWKTAGSLVVPIEAPLELVSDIFSEAEHIPWVHGRVGWSKEASPGVDLQFHDRGAETEVIYNGPQGRNPALRPVRVSEGDRFVSRWTTRFDPFRVSLEISWESPQDGRTRPFRTRTIVFMVPETDKSVRLHVFFSYRLEGLKLLEPLLKWSIPRQAAREFQEDKRFLETVLAGNPHELKGMKLRRFDKPVAVHRKKLETLYFGRGDSPASS